MTEQAARSGEDVDGVAVAERADGASVRGAARRNASRRQLLEAARDICRDGTFLSCSIADITNRAHLSRAAFYLHFKSKEEILGVLLKEQLEWYIRQHNTITAEQATSVAGLTRWFRQFIEGFRASGELMALYRVDRTADMVAQEHRHTRMRAIEALGHRIPALRLFHADGSVDAVRQRAILLYVFQMEQACYAIAHSHSNGEQDETMLLEALADNFLKLTS